MDPTSAQGPGNQQSPANGGIPQSPANQVASPINPTQTPQPSQPQQPSQPVQQPVQPQQQFTQATVVQPTPQPNASEVLEDKPKKSKVKIFGILIVFLFLLFFLASAVLGYAIAYEKVKLENYPEVQAKVAGYVQSLPFMPKTAKYLLVRSIIAHQNVTKHNFDVSLALDSSSLSDVLGINKFDTEAKGAIDYSDPQNVVFTLNASFTKEFNIEAKSKDPILYFKINKFPSFIFSLIGINDEMVKPYLERWIAYDTTPLDTQARKELTDKEVEPLSQEFLVEINEKYLDDYILDQMEITETEEDGVDYYKISLNADKELIDYFGKRLEEESTSDVLTQTSESYELSDMIKELSWEIYIAKDTYYTHKLKVTSTLEFDEGFYGSAFLGNSADLAQNSQANFALVIQFDDFGKEVLVEKPENYIAFEEFLSLSSDIFTANVPGLTLSTDAQRITDVEIVRDFLGHYSIICGKYPENLEGLVTPYPQGECESLVGTNYEIPKDPSGSDYYYKVTEGGDGYDLCARLDSPIPEKDTCPDKDYNYHLTAP